MQLMRGVCERGRNPCRRGSRPRRPSAPSLSRVLSLAVALSLAAVTVADAQETVSASFVADGSFTLSGGIGVPVPEKPVAVAIAPDSSIYVLDEDGPVYHYERSGNFRRTFAQNWVKKGVDLEVGSDGRVFVLDGDDKRVYAFPPEGEGEVPLAIGRSGGGGGGIDDPVDLDVGPAGFLYVLKEDAWVEIFAPSGLYVRSLKLPGLVGGKPRGLAVARDGGLLVADENGAVAVLPAFPRYPWTANVGQVSITAVGQGGKPGRAAVSPRGTVIWVDRETQRIRHRNPAGGESAAGATFLYGGKGTGRGAFQEIADLDFDDSDQALILDRKLKKLERIRVGGQGGFDRLSSFDFPIRVTEPGSPVPGTLLAAGATQEGRWEVLRSQASTLSILGTRDTMAVTAAGDTVRFSVPAPGELRTLTPTGGQQKIGDATLDEERVLVSYPDENQYVVFDRSSGDVRGAFGAGYQDQRRLDEPRGLALRPDGTLAVADKGNDRVAVFSSDLTSLVTTHLFEDPVGVTSSPEGRLLVWDEDGEEVGFAPTGTEAWEPFPADLRPSKVGYAVYGPAGNLYLLNRETGRVRIIDAGLERVLVQLGRTSELEKPRHLAVGGMGSIYVSDEDLGRAVVLHWDVRPEPLASVSVRLQPEAVEVSWEPGGDTQYLTGYRVDGATGRDGPWREVGTVEGTSYRAAVSDFEGGAPGWLRVAPVSITGSVGAFSEPVPVLNVTAAAAREAGDHATALRTARDALAVDSLGRVMTVTPEARIRLLRTAFESAAALDHPAEAAGWGRKLAGRLPSGEKADVLARVAGVQLAAGEPEGSRDALLEMVSSSAPDGPVADSSVVDLTFRVAGALDTAAMAEAASDTAGAASDTAGAATDTAGTADTAQVARPGPGLQFLTDYSEALPAGADSIQQLYSDSVTVRSSRAALGPALDRWRNANYGGVIRFLLGKLETPEQLSEQQELLARQLLAGAFYVQGLRPRAGSAFEPIYEIAPDFDVETAMNRIDRLYGITIYNDQMLSYFSGLKP